MLLILTKAKMLLVDTVLLLELNHQENCFYLCYLLLSDVLSTNYCNKAVLNLSSSKARAEDTIQFTLSGRFTNF